MGLFGSTKTYVSSTVYNLAGEETGRPNYLKSIIVGSTLLKDDRSRGEIIQASYQKGRGIQLRSFYRWALANYSLIGIPEASLQNTREISPEVVAQAIPKPVGSTAFIQTAEMGPADYSYWAERWMFEYYPNLLDTDWLVDYVEAENKIQITFEDDTKISFVPADFDTTADYIYAAYTLDLGGSLGPLVPGTEVVLAAIENYPSVSGWKQLTNSSIQVTQSLLKVETTAVSYSDGRVPPADVVVKTSNDEIYDTLASSYSRSTYQGEVISTTVDRLKAVDSFMHLSLTASVVDAAETSTTSSETLPGGVTKTTVVRTAQQRLSYKRSYRIDTQQRIVQDWSSAKIFIYRIGSGNAELDALTTDTAGNEGANGLTKDGYLPFIPLRLDNKFLSSSYLPAAYEISKKAYKKAMNGSLDELVDKLKDNKDLKDIDYAYVMFGVSLNTKDPSCRKYIYQFFNKLRVSQSSDKSAYNRWKDNQALADSDMASLVAWRLAQKITGSPLYGTKAPEFDGSWSAPIKEIRIQGTGPAVPTNVDIRISWSDMTEVRGTGLLKPDAKVGDIWFTQGTQSVPSKLILSFAEAFDVTPGTHGEFELCWQISATRWKKIVVNGLVHRNYIYGGKYVETTVANVFADAEESDFLIPIHYNTFREMSLVDATQMGGECSYVVLNSYQVVKTKWYQTGFFKILLVVVIVAVIILFPPAAGATGLLGTSVAVGAAVGLSGLAALIVGTVINVLAAMLLVQLIQVGAVALFGEKLGAIIGAIAGIVAVGGITGFSNGQSFSTVVNSMTRADSLIALTSSLGDAVSQVVMAGAQELSMKTQKLMEDYSKDSKALSELYAKNLGYDTGSFDPMGLTDAPAMLLESSGGFLQRTLMTGSDIARLSMDMVYGFPEFTLSNKLPL